MKKASMVLGTLLLFGCLDNGGNKDKAGGSNFTISGRVGAVASALSTQTATTTEKTVTHVVAITASSTDIERVVSEVTSDGEFSLDIGSARPWVLVFVDNSRTGADKMVGVFKADALDTLAPTNSTGAADLGTVDLADGHATAGIAYDDLLAALGLDSATATLLGSVDDLCLRYVNPDIDGDGVLDALQQGHDYRLDFHTRFNMDTGGNPATIADIVGQFLPDDAGMTFTGTGVYVSVAGASPNAMDSASVTFDEAVHYNPFSGFGTSLQAANAPIPSAELNRMTYGEYLSFGIDTPPGFDLPQSRYRFSVGGRTLTFTNVRTRTDAELTAATNFILPFVKFNPTDSSCTSNCTIASVDYRWMKRTESGWVNATLAEVTLIVSESGGFISIVRAHDNGQQKLGITIPIEATSGTIAWSASSGHLENMSEAEMTSMTTSQICHFGLSYDDKLGMRMFEGIFNAPGTCENE